MGLSEQVMLALDEVRPALLADGGDVELVEAAPGVVRVRFTGACHECSAQEHTLLYIVQRAVQERAPEVRSVVVVP